MPQLPNLHHMLTDCVQEEKAGTLPPLMFRVAGGLEPTPDLRHPQFERGLVPLLFSPEWAINFSGCCCCLSTCGTCGVHLPHAYDGVCAGHTFGNSATWLFAHLFNRNLTWSDRVALVVRTEYGLALPKFWQSLVGPLAQACPVQTLAE